MFLLQKRTIGRKQPSLFVVLIIALVFQTGCTAGNGPSVTAIKQARHAAAVEISKNAEYQSIKDWLTSQDFSIWPNASIDALKLQAELDIALLSSRKLGYSAFAEPSVVSLPEKALYREYDREISNEIAAHGMATMTGTITMPSKEPGKQYQITMLGTTEADAVSGIGGQGMVIAATGQIEQPKALYNTAVIQGICSSMIVEPSISDSLLFSTSLPRDRIILYSSSPLSREFRMLLPTGPGSIIGIRGTVSGLFPGLTIHSDDTNPIWFALTKEMGLIYLMGKGHVSYTATKRPDAILGGS